MVTPAPKKPRFATSKRQLAALIGVSYKHLLDLQHRGCPIEKVGPRKLYSVARARRWLEQRRKREEKERSSSSGQRRLAARVRYLESQARRQEQKLARERVAVMSMETVRRRDRDRVRLVRRELRKFGRRLVKVCRDGFGGSVALAEAAIEHEVRLFLEEMSRK